MPLNLPYIITRRKQLGLSQSAAAALAGFGGETPARRWSQFECGRIPDPRLSTMEAMARALGCSIQKLVKR